MAGRTRRPRTDAVDILRRRYVTGDADAEMLLDEVRTEEELARTIHRLRTEAGLTQEALAKMIGTTASVISRLEDADYDGHSLPMLRRIAAALGRRVEIRFPVVKVDSPPKRGSAACSEPPAGGQAIPDPGPRGEGTVPSPAERKEAARTKKGEAAHRRKAGASS